MTSNRLTQTYLPLYVILSTILLSTACITGAPSKTDIIGTPPLPSEDPFAVAIPLSEYDEAPTSGHLTGDNFEEIDEETFSQEEANASQLTDKTTDSPYSTNQNTSPKKAPSSQQIKTKQLHTYHCYSCIGVCIHESEKTTCKNEKDELCGWGASKDLRSAQLMATEQCRGSLLKYTPVKNLSSEGATCSIPYCE